MSCLPRGNVGKNTCLPKGFVGKSSHTLLKKNSAANCFYCEKSNAFSCVPYKCDEPMINTKKPDVTALACRYITEFATENCQSGFEWLVEEEIVNTFPEKHCKIRLERNFIDDFGNIQTNPVVDFEDRVFTIIIPVDTPAVFAGDIVYSIDGVECFRCTLG